MERMTMARLVLRPVTEADRAAVVVGVGDLAVSRWLMPVPHPYTSADFDHFLTNIATPGQTFAIDHADGFCGIVGLKDGILGYWLCPVAQGKGFATEAARAVLADWFSRETQDVTSGYFADNARSAHLLGKLGFIEVGRDVRHCRALGASRAHVIVALTRDRFVAALPIEAQSARLAFRSWQATDFDALHALNSDWEVVRQLGSWPWPPEADFTRSRAMPFGGTGFAWAVLAAGQVIGGVSVTNGVLGYSIGRAHWRLGYGREAATTALSHAFKDTDLLQITASAWADNAASLDLMASLGFTQTARTREMSKARKEETDLVHLTLTRAAWADVAAAPRGA